MITGIIGIILFGLWAFSLQVKVNNHQSTLDRMLTWKKAGVWENRKVSWLMKSQMNTTKMTLVAAKTHLPLLVRKGELDQLEQEAGVISLNVTYCRMMAYKCLMMDDLEPAKKEGYYQARDEIVDKLGKDPDYFDYDELGGITHHISPEKIKELSLSI